MITHLACIMSGNRTWARRKGLLPWLGYKDGVETIKRVINFCIEKQISYLSLYTFSIENFKRPLEERNYMFEVLAQEESDSLLAQALEKGVKVQFLGDRSLFPQSVKALFERMEQRTAALTNMTVNFLFCYGGRQEIVAAARAIVQKVKVGELEPEQINAELFANHLWTAGIPDPDLIIRPDGENRLSNFLLYQAAYAELYFLDCLWPGLTMQHLQEALDHFKNVKRNFGG